MEVALELINRLSHNTATASTTTTVSVVDIFIPVFQSWGLGSVRNMGP